ncbi:efflux transporter outer membrane subunit [Silvimonas sp. JCM 19000]
MKAVRSVLALALLQGLIACSTVGPDYHVPASAALNNPAAQAAFAGAHDPAVAIAPVPEQWWQLYNDPTLNQLVQEALVHNADLRVADANLRKAIALQNQVDAERDIDAKVGLAAKRAEESGEQFLLSEKLPVINEGDFGISLAYQIDLFGKLKRGEEAADANTQASLAALDLARVNVAVQTVRAYVQGCSAAHEYAVAQHELDLQNQTVAIAQRLLKAGRGRDTDVIRAQAQTDLLRANMPRYQAEQDVARFRLAVMLGKAPQELAPLNCQIEPSLAQPLPVGDGTALLKRRPDIRQAERELAGATAKIGVATAELYPSITIGASAGLTGVIEDMPSSPTARWGFGPLLSWDIPGAGAHARIRAAEAGADGALAHFDSVVLNALRETESALTTYTHDLQRNADLRSARDKAHIVAQQNAQLYKAGRSPYLTSLDATRTLANADSALAASDSQLAQDQINLFMALGGGWQNSPAVAQIHATERAADKDAKTAKAE